ncbi:MAG: hypothetical protein QOD13_1465 [Thermoleophilaceae bacterium]|jgi:hypothetical protein|nr:hypothetical protein [Thermoleophilaceae bacterium]
MLFPSRIPSALGVALLALALALIWAVPASAQAPDALVPQSVLVDGPDKAPPGFTVTPRAARRTVERLDEVRSALADHPKARVYVQLPMYGSYRGQYAVTFIDASQGEVVADVYVDGRSGRVLNVYTGPQAGTFLARGLKPLVGRSLNKPYIWLALAVLFLAPFVDPRRPFRLVHLDLLVLLSFGISQLYFNRGEIDLSVPLVYPPLLYLLARVLLAGFRPRERAEPLMPYAKASWLVVGLGLLVAFRIGLNVVDSSVIDVGYASVVGADRVMHGLPLYVLNDIHGDTYGPLNYLSYVPFVALLPWDGAWDSVVPAHAAAITFDLLVIGGLVQLGRRMRDGAEGTLLGLAFAWAWAAYPFSVLALQTNTNDALLAALLLGALLAISSPSGRGLLIGLGTAAKFAPLALAPLFATGLGDERRLRAWPAFAAALVAVCLGSVIFLLPEGGWREFYDTTIGFQLGRSSPFSLWGLHSSLDWLQTIAKVGAAALVVLVAFVPRRRDLRQVAALAAGVLIALQLTTTYWFYLYLVWIAPPVLVAVLGAYRGPVRAQPEPPAVPDAVPEIYAPALAGTR